MLHPDWVTPLTLSSKRQLQIPDKHYPTEYSLGVTLSWWVMPKLTPELVAALAAL